MPVEHVWVGRTAVSSAWVRAKIDGTLARLAVSTSPDLSGASFIASEVPTAGGMVSFEPLGLAPGTQHYFAVEVDDVLDTDFAGRFRTHPAAAGQAASFAFWAGTCAGSGTDTFIADQVSNHPVFDTIQSHPLDFLFGWQGGDIHYRDINTDDADLYRQAYDDVLTFNDTLGADARQGRLYRTVPLAHSWDDHDFDSDNSDGTYAHKANAAEVYRERVPHYTLPDPDGAIYQSWTIGRVLFIAADVRFHRSPNTDPDNTSKTMLGQAQKDWMRGLLSTSDARLLIWLQPDQWTQSDGDTWGSFAVEREELIAMFDELGWLDRMMIVQGDSHSLGMQSGATNEHGGMPVYQFAPLDSTPSSGAPSLWDVGLVGNTRGCWGSVEITDDGSQISVTGTGWVENTPQFSHTFTVGDPAPEPPSPDPLPEVAQAQIRTRLTWLACNLSDGAVITELPDLQGDEVSSVIGEYTSASLQLPIPAVGPDGLSLAQRAALATSATQPPRTMLVVVVNDVPLWMGIVLPRDRGTDATMQLGTVSVEGYLRHRYIGDHSFDGVDVATIATALLQDAGDAHGGTGIGLVIDAPPTGVTATRDYVGTDDQTVYAGLSELMDAGLIEWTVSPDWSPGLAGRRVEKIARVRTQLGVSGPPTAVFDSAVFSSQGASDATYMLNEDYSGDRYANVVRLRGPGQGEDQPRSAPAIDQAQLDSGIPVWELRDSAAQNVTEQADLDRHATQRLARVRQGARTLDITARWDADGTRPAVDWSLGDVIGHELVGHAHPDGLNGQRRAIGFALSIQRGTVRPILQEDE